MTTPPRERDGLEFLDGNRGDTERVYFIEADVPVPEQPTLDNTAANVAVTPYEPKS